MFYRGARSRWNLGAKHQTADRGRVESNRCLFVGKAPSLRCQLHHLFGLLLQVQSLWLCLVASLAYWMYYERIICAEEHFLHGKFGETFRQWASRTPAVVPNFSHWCKPSLPFSWKMVLRREYSTLFLVICAQVAIVIVRVRDVSTVSQYWLLGCYFAAGAGVYFGLRWLKKNTACLYVPPRS